MILYDYYRSSASYRVRIALHLKGITYEKHGVHLINNGGEQHHADYISLNPQALVPTLVTDDGHVISQSLAIIEYLDECFPEPPLLPDNALQRAEVRNLALLVACDIHPLNNLRVLNQLRQQFEASDQDVLDWMHHWMHSGFAAFEHKLQKAESTGMLCYGDQISLADTCLIPQVYNARRFQLNMDSYPIINDIYAYCTSLDVFKLAEPVDPS
ncbi:maleylacetoacetate isomerase [Legionella sp. CNM-4043-24]|uniref:maleylacetoacetate isomerase n=1 Tax=Legionella sp. CNM-4043-24 TaxID=3421646 RepID=UPI00403ADD54